VWTSNPSGALQVVIKDVSLVSKYAFGTRTAEFHICARCGVVPVVTSRIDDCSMRPCFAVPRQASMAKGSGLASDGGSAAGSAM
jgi:hypothetical protein